MKTREWWVSGIEGERGSTNIVGGANPGQPTNPHGWIRRPSSSSTDECEHHEHEILPNTCNCQDSNLCLARTRHTHVPNASISLSVRVF
ncbi:hypothetical protein NC651_006520 [Populus alba x Populus x berolinensis]|nr:hypothetical protein NC651_006520 [Populus alba x Populus x berolinensis]